MPAERRCEKCGAALAPFGPAALCPNCMLREALSLVADATASPADAGPGQTAAVAVTPLTEKPGDKIGRYKLLQAIGEGGMGVVYMAEQEEPVRRKVALKVIKLGMDTKSVIARFEAERQALALMDHPNIAKVLDAGATDTGRPYFVMELVRGIRITDYCDENHLSTPQRLGLFTQVCQAIQHAHQKGVIHRDIKPSNILVTLHDGVPVPKIIDFGIAKATSDQRLTDKTLFTAFEQFLGTPAYMSPEQAELSGLDIDTRSDIYSLGVLLYELLTGQTPFEAKDLLAAGLDAMRRTIREKEPPKPSTRLTMELVAAPRQRAANSGDENGGALPRRRYAQIQELIKLVRGDLDWIVMKALEKDRARRYESANGLAMDIQRHLDNEPVVARPPNAAYRFQKLVRRNKIAVAAVSAVVAALIIGLGVSTWEYFKEKAARKRAVFAEQKSQTEARKSEQVARFLKDMLQGVGPSVALGRDTKMLREILDKTAERVGKDLKDEPEVQAELLSTLGNTYVELFETAKAEEMHREALRLRKTWFGGTNEQVAASLNDLGNVLIIAIKYAEADLSLREALQIRQELFGKEHPDVATSLYNLARVVANRGNDPEAETLLREALAMQKKLGRSESPEVARTLGYLGQVLQRQNKLAAAETFGRKAVALNENLFGKDHPEVAGSLVMLSATLRAQNNLTEAEILLRQVIEMWTKFLGNAHPQMALQIDNLAQVLRQEGKVADAESLYDEYLQSVRTRLPADEPALASALALRARILLEEAKFVEAEPLARECLSICEKKLPDDWRTFNARSILGGGFLGQKKYPEAEPLLLSGYEGMKQREDRMAIVSKPRLKEALQRLVKLYEVINRPTLADEWKQKLEEFSQAAPATMSAVETKPR